MIDLVLCTTNKLLLHEEEKEISYNNDNLTVHILLL